MEKTKVPQRFVVSVAINGRRSCGSIHLVSESFPCESKTYAPSKANLLTNKILEELAFFWTHGDDGVANESLCRCSRAGCTRISGTGLEPLRGSRMLREIDLRLDTTYSVGPVELNTRFVLPLLSSMPPITAPPEMPNLPDGIFH